MVRNFYLAARIDGRKTRLTGGPRTKDGGFDLVITQRHEGTIQEAATIMGRVRPDGSLVLIFAPGSALQVSGGPVSDIIIRSKR